MTRKPRSTEGVPTLSPQQKTALWLFACGNSVVQAAALMGIRPTTAKEHLHRAYKALGVHSGVHAVHLAYQFGIFKAPAHADAEAAAEKIQVAAMKLGIMSSTMPGGGLASMLRDMARSLNLSLVDLRYDTAESPRQGMARALESRGIFDVNPEFLGLTFEGHQDIAYAVDIWDWADSEVADKALMHCVCDMLGLTEMQYTDAMENNRAGLLEAFWTAHEEWS